jgi:diaminohydroxyphosphoribosylaminopyrimidine deaminase/5-amino-6-(5-phosphoribosylamino)uracil reductase
LKEEYMRRAIELAKKGCGYTNPNPLVGAVIVKDQRVIGEGYHEKIGGLHAERNALKNCIEDPEGAEIYVTLEPCCHYGKTQDCKMESLFLIRLRTTFSCSGNSFSRSLIN